MSYDIIVRFPDKELADKFCGQMSDGFGEGFCDFSFSQQKDGADGTKPEHYERIEENGKKVFFVDSIFDDF